MRWPPPGLENRETWGTALTALNDAQRATILEGATLASQSGHLLVLAVWGGISFVLALRWFRWA